ncbi:hypothetical protein CRYUN_Cryun19dG0127600 [Craigia yunnanensis]
MWFHVAEPMLHQKEKLSSEKALCFMGKPGFIYALEDRVPKVCPFHRLTYKSGKLDGENAANAFITLYITLAHAATFNIRNNCPYTVWAAAAPGGGRQFNHGQVWDLNVSSGTGSARIWARTNCEFDEAGKGQCQTGDCGGFLQCQGYGVPPNTLAEYT